MQAASAAQEFEEAARLRNRLTSLRTLAQRQHVDSGSSTYDVVAIAMEEGIANVQLFPVRSGRLDERRSMYLENIGESPPGELLVSFLAEYYAQQVGVPPLVVVPVELDDQDVLEEYLSERRGSSVEVRVAARGEKRRMLEMAERNAELALKHEALAAARTRARRAEALEELREALDLEALPVRIECFDASNTGESQRVAAMVVFEEAVPRRSDYRTFAIRHEGGQDDFRSIGEAVRRRFARYRLVDEEGYDRSFSTLPNLVVIDGGKGQLAAALAAMREFDLPRVAVVSLAKREEEVFVPGRAASVRLPARLRRPAAAAAHPRRDAPLRDHVPPQAPRARADDVAARRSARRGRAAARRAAAPLRCRRPAARREPRGARGRARSPAEGRARSLRSSAPHRNASLGDQGLLRVVTYAVDGWGIGELALLDDRPVSHELPRALTQPGPGPRRGRPGRRVRHAPASALADLRVLPGRARELDGGRASRSRRASTSGASRRS